MSTNPSLYIRLRNSFHPGLGSCSKCGANWGWKEWTSHSTSPDSALFLFCIDCDRTVTLEERWKALDAWKELCKDQLLYLHLQPDSYRKELQTLDQTEFIEFPRSKKETNNYGNKLSQ